MKTRSLRTLLLTAIVVVLVICIAPFGAVQPIGLRAWRIARLIVLAIGLTVSLVRELVPATKVRTGHGVRSIGSDIAPTVAFGRVELLEWNCAYLC